MARLAELNARLKQVDLSGVHPDPLYALFVREMLAQERAELAEKPALSRSEVLEQRRTAEEIVRRIRGSEGQT